VEQFNRTKFTDNIVDEFVNKMVLHLFKSKTVQIIINVTLLYDLSQLTPLDFIFFFLELLKTV
jgi:hypothetical protein